MGYGLFRNATAQYTAIEKSIMESQKKRDAILALLTDKNAVLNGIKLNILDILNSFEFKRGILNTHYLGDSNLSNTQIEVERGLVFDPSNGKIKTSSGTNISDLTAFLNTQNLGYNCNVTSYTDKWKSRVQSNDWLGAYNDILLKNRYGYNEINPTYRAAFPIASINDYRNDIYTGYSGVPLFQQIQKSIINKAIDGSIVGECISDYGVNQNPSWAGAKAALISAIGSYRAILAEVSSLQSKLNSEQANVDRLKKDLDAAAKQDPALLKAKALAEAKEKEAKIAADAEVEKLRITKEADAKLKEAEEEAKKKQLNKLLIFGGLGVAAIAAVLILRK